MPALLRLKECLCTGLNASGLGEGCRCTLLHGLGASPAFPAIGKSTAWVGLLNVFPSKTFPSPAVDLNTCIAPIAANVTVGVLRCYQVRTSGETEAELRDYLDVQMADMAAMRRAIVCCANDGFAISLGTYSPVGPEGGIYGGAWTLVIGEE
jgi:hypothetical protein